eukprot:9118209-Heterocapsa_arctica.AAC.1
MMSLDGPLGLLGLLLCGAALGMAVPPPAAPPAAAAVRDFGVTANVMPVYTFPAAKGAAEAAM